MERFGVDGGQPFTHSNFPEPLLGWTNLKYISITGRGISGELPADLFEKWGNLTHLHLNSNSLNGTLPSRGWSKLIRVDLSYNKLQE